MPRTCAVDTSPLQYLFRNHLDLLRACFDRVLAARAVLLELDQGRSSGFAVPDLSDFPWIEVTQVETSEVPEVLLSLGPGERETLLVARERQIDRVILDDLAARRSAARLGLQVMGTMGLLVLAQRRGLIPVLAPLLEELVEAGMWLSEDLKQDILTLAGER